MPQTLPSSVPTAVPTRARISLRTFAFAAGLLALLGWSGVSRADSCGAFISLNNLTPQVTCVVPSTGSMQTGMKNMSFTTPAQGVVLIYSDSTHTSLSDVITFENVNGIATVAYTSSITGSSSVAGLPVLGTYTDDQKFIFLSLALTNGKVLHAGICNDASGGTACNGGSGSVRLSVGNVPEPGTFMLLGTGVLGSGIWSLGAGWKKRLLRLKG